MRRERGSGLIRFAASRARKVGPEARVIITSYGCRGPVAQLGARQTGSLKVRGSTPLGSTIRFRDRTPHTNDLKGAV